MLVKVIKTYNDKNTKVKCNEGTTHEYEEERANFLIQSGFVEEVKEKKKEEATEPEKVVEQPKKTKSKK